MNRKNGASGAGSSPPGQVSLYTTGRLKSKEKIRAREGQKKGCPLLREQPLAIVKTDQPRRREVEWPEEPEEREDDREDDDRDDEEPLERDGAE